MNSALAAGLLTTFVLIVVGALLRTRLRFRETFWSDLERLVYWILLPALLVLGLAQADFADIAVGRFVAALIGSCLVGAALALATRRFAVGSDGPAFTSLFQGTVRFNNYVGLTIITALYAADGLSLAALANAVLVPVGNILSILALARFGRHDGVRPRVVHAVVTNPLVLACAVGLLLNLASRSGAAAVLWAAPVSQLIFASAQMVLHVLGQAALPIGLLCVGAGIRVPQSWRAAARVIGTSVVLRLACVPAATLPFCRVLNLSGPAGITVVVFAALPTATSSYLLARRLGGDAPLMATITAAQTVVAFVTLPAWILLSRAVL